MLNSSVLLYKRLCFPNAELLRHALEPLVEEFLVIGELKVNTHALLPPSRPLGGRRLRLLSLLYLGFLLAMHLWVRRRDAPLCTVE